MKRKVIGFISLILFSLALVSCDSERVKRAEKYIESGEYTEAIDLLNRETRINPKNAKAYYLLGLAHLYKGEDYRGEESFNQATVLESRYRSRVADAYYRNGLLYFNEGNPAKATHYFKAAFKRNSSLGEKIAEFYFQKGSEIANSTNDALRAILHLKMSLEFDDSLRKKAADLCYFHAQDTMKRGFLEAAYYYGGCNMWFDSTYTKDIAALFYDIGVRFSEKGEAEKTLGIFGEAARLYPDYTREDVRFLYYLAEYYQSEGRRSKAKELYTQVASDFPQTDFGRMADDKITDLMQPVSITVQVDQLWTKTGIKIAKGENLNISATGEIVWDSTITEHGGKVGPDGSSWKPVDGVPNPERFLLSTAPCGSLVGRIGNGLPFLVGSSYSGAANDSGELELAVNDDSSGIEDNSGSWTVKITFSE